METTSVYNKTVNGMPMMRRTTCTTFDVEELLHADISSESSFRDHISLLANELQRNLNRYWQLIYN